MCKKIHRGGNAEQYYADKKYKEALAVAVEACAEDAKGQTCYICLEAVHPSTGEGLVRGCACQGEVGFAHVSCLVRQNECLVEPEVLEREGFNLNSFDEKLLLCSLCKRRHDADILHALGWGYWKLYAGKPERRSYKEAIMMFYLYLLQSGCSEEAEQVTIAVRKMLAWRQAESLSIQTRADEAEALLEREQARGDKLQKKLDRLRKKVDKQGKRRR